MFDNKDDNETATGQLATQAEDAILRRILEATNEGEPEKASQWTEVYYVFQSAWFVGEREE